MPINLVSSNTLENDNLFVTGVTPVETDTVILKGGKAYKRGDVLGLLDAGQATVVDSTKTDGSQDPYGVLADDTDATDGDVAAVVYLTGNFNETELKFGGTDTVVDHKKALRTLGIFVKRMQ